MLILAAWLHTIDPYAIKLWEGGPIRWYGLSYLVGFLVGYLLIRRVARVGISTLTPQRVGDFVVAVAIGVVVGGRLGYVLLYQPELLWTRLDHFPFWGVLAINQGGMASHGGILGGFIACLYYARRHHHSTLFLVDLVGFGTPMGLCFGRIANFINGELYGRKCDEDFIFAVRFPQEMYDWPREQLLTVHPTMPDPYKLVAVIQNGNAAVIEAVTPHLTARHPSQMYQALMEGLLLFLVLLWVWRKPRKPGTIFASFFIGYAVFRIVGELFRMPDAHVGYQWLDLTRGQWLSVPLLIIGVALLIWAQRRKVEPMGSWRQTRPEGVSDLSESAQP